MIGLDVWDAALILLIAQLPTAAALVVVAVHRWGAR